MVTMSSSRPTRLALVDDHAIVEVALRAALADIASVEFLGLSPTVHDLLAEHRDAELVVLDLRLADGSSPISNVTALREQGMRVIAYTSGEDPYLVRLVARTEVLGIVRKSAPVGVLLETIHVDRVGCGDGR
jgi:DNA-binding NarL/FixJ family response regulator